MKLINSEENKDRNQAKSEELEIENDNHDDEEGPDI
eukprot:CAMPEP_0116882272 /NCGR_PEP_ID=MMETSP0463-20121206/14471_1 /TAXON_ID=181622 /ORGANISM="Strombidinopsis sp, Strain SopsisLIS2011" /LENGTH=35 /DNA_ID= /DNA_START= /DNA_END= /DNA_ORIENTATION=